MEIARLLAIVPLALLCVATGAAAAPCASEDFETRVSGNSGCLLMRRYGPETPRTLIVWLHGNVSTGGPANSHFRVAEATAREFEREQVLVVALVRPGYPDGSGAYSSGTDQGRADNWQRETLADLGEAIGRLRRHFMPDALVLTGHSGGAAIAAVLLGMQPALAESAILIGCPCDMQAWRAGRGRTPWLSENPLSWTDSIRPSARVIALTGDKDEVTPPVLARTYIDRLQARGIDAAYAAVPAAGHLDVLKSPAILAATARLLRRPPH